MNRKNLILPAILVAFIYIWLWYAVNFLSNPLLAMLVYHPILCIGGGFLVLKFTGGTQSGSSTQLIPTGYAAATIILAALMVLIIRLTALTLIQPGLIDPIVISSGLASLGMTSGKFWIIAGWLVLLNPFAEEFFWRGVVLNRLSVAFPRIWAVIIASLLFAGYHPIVISKVFPASWLPLVFILTFLGGIIFSELYLQTRRFTWPVLLHTVINIQLMLIGYSMAPSSTP